MRILQDTDRKEIITNDLVKVFYRIMDFKGKEDLIEIFDVLKKNCAIMHPDRIICKEPDGTVRKEYRRVKVYYEEYYNPHFDITKRIPHKEFHDAMKEFLADLTDSDVKEVAEYFIEDENYFGVRINILEGAIEYFDDRKKCRKESGYPRYYMYLERYIVRNEWAYYYKVNENMEWERIDRAYIDEIWDLDDLTEDDVLKVYPKEILEKIPLETIQYEYERLRNIEKDSLLDRAQRWKRDPKPPMAVLYKADNIYESEEITAYLIDHMLCVVGVTSKKAPGGMYRTFNALSVEDTKQLMHLLETNENGLLHEMEWKFNGANAESKFREYCRNNGLQVRLL